MNENQIILTKESSENDIRRYFEGVLQLSKSSEEFPVNLDEVWPLVYGTKGNAIVALKKSFVKDIDYKVIGINPKNHETVDNQSLMISHKRSNGGQNKEDYYLTTSCLEYFIARKVRPVFEVYRAVFHKVANSQIAALPDFSNPAEAARAWAEQYELKQIETRRADEAEKQVLTLTKEIESAQPKITYFEAFMNSVHGSKASCIREVVKQAHIKSETEFIAWMLRKHILFRSGKGNRLQPYAEYTSYFDIIDVYDAKNDWSGKQLKINPYGKNKVVKRYHDEHPEAFYEQKQLFNI